MDHNPTVVQQLKDLSKVHDDVIGKISERNAAVDERLRGWDEYRRRQDDLFLWMRAMEREKLALNLKHVRLDKIPATLEKIQVHIS